MKNTRNLKLLVKASSQNKIFFQAVHISIFTIYDLKDIFYVQIVYIVEQSEAFIDRF